MREAIVTWSEWWLVRGLRQQDAEACRELIRRHHRAVYGYLRHMGADEATAEDLTQETFTRAWQAVERLRAAGSLRAWLLRIARNEFLQLVRRARPAAHGPIALPETADPGPGGHEVVAIHERDSLLRRAVRSLDVEQREVIALHYFEDLSLREISAVLEIPAGTVKSRLHRALERLRELLGQEARDDAGCETIERRRAGA